MTERDSMTLGALMYNDFELLDLYGPLEMFGLVGPELRIVTVAETAGDVKSFQGPRGNAQYGFGDCPPLDLLLVPGGLGTTTELDNSAIIDFARTRAAEADLVMSVCTGSALLAKAGVLNGHRATSNKQFFFIATSQSEDVEWVEEARWVDDGNVVTSSGVSAGIDMALAVIERLWGAERAEYITAVTEYDRQHDSDVDHFVQYINQGPSMLIGPEGQPTSFA